MRRLTLRIIASVLVLFTLSASAALGSAAEGGMPFKDVPASEWYYEPVKYVYDAGIMKGMTNKTFEPETTVTRAMFVTMLGRLWGVEQKITNKFRDVTPETGDWYAGYVGWASENGIVNGYPNGTFLPDDPLTREQMAAILSRFISYSGLIPMKSYDPVSFFTDENKIEGYAVPHVDKMRELGIVTGNADGSFNPQGNLTRAEAATVMMRLDRMVDSLTLGDPIKPDYTEDDGAFVLMSAWDLYYSGTALSTAYEGIGVKEDGEAPYIAEDPDGLTFYFALRGDNVYGVGLVRRTDPNELVSGDAFSIDAVMDCIDLYEYPVVRFGYSVPDGCSASFGVWSDDKGEKMIEMNTGDEGGGWSYGIASVEGSDAFSGNSERIGLTLIGTGDLKLRYFAAFRSERDAEAFDLSKYADRMKNFDGEVAEVKEGDVDRAYADAYAQRDKIFGSANAYGKKDVKGTCYYISSVNGDDKNDGKSPATAWKSFVNLYKVWGDGVAVTSVPRAGDGVFLERGSVFYKNAAGKYDYLTLTPGVIYGAYGEGDKPVITNRCRFDTPTGKWVATEWENVWRLDEGDFREMPGNIVFRKDGRESWGIFVVTDDPESPFESERSVPYGWVSNGEEKFESGGVPFSSPGDLQHNLEYIGDRKNGGLWVYCDRGNPGEIYDEIVISKSGDLVFYSGESLLTAMPTRLDNVEISFTGGLGLDMFGAVNVYVTNCVFEWIGGQYQDGDVRFGNALQNWGSCDGVVVKDCYFKDVYDAAVTTQGRSGDMRNFYSTGCVLDRCDLSFEFFNDGNYREDLVNRFVNIFITDNYVINNGIGFCDVRTDRRSAFLYTSYGIQNTVMENILYEGNVNIISTEFGLVTHEAAFGQTAGSIFRNNTYYMDPRASFFINGIYNMRDRTGRRAVLYPFTSQYLTFLTNMGIERGSAFYTATNPVREPVE
ncbi:MAG: S-layer homology domain-containing protein [Clostridia bacterium]|nr:S-layer homology domain-containing protein [Clostridia bacterium]